MRSFGNRGSKIEEEVKKRGKTALLPPRLSIFIQRKKKNPRGREKKEKGFNAQVL